MTLLQPLPVETGLQVLLRMAAEQGAKHTNGQHNGAEAHGGTHTGRHAHAVAGYAGHNVFLRVAIKQSGPGPGHRRGQGKAQVAAMVHGPGAEQVAATDQRQTGRHHARRAEARCQAGANTRADQHAQGKWQHAQARRNGTETQTVLQIKRQQSHHHLGTAGIGKHAQQGADKARLTEQLQVNHGPPLHGLDQHKQPQQQHPGTYPGVGQRVVPANTIGFDQAPDQAQQAGAESQAAPGVEPRRLRVAGFSNGLPDQ